MYSESDLEGAVAAGVLSRDTAQAFRDHVAGQRAALPADEEHFRLITGFNDIFVGLATIILLVAVGWIANTVGPRIEGVGPSPFAGLAVAATAWGLAEVFTRRRRMALPSIILLIAFVGGIFEMVGVSGALLAEYLYGPNIDDQIGEGAARSLAAAVITAAAMAATLAAWLHWRRFIVPISVAAGTAAVAALIVSLFAIAFGDQPWAGDALLVIVLVLGLAVFAYAMRWDASDVQRQTRRSDVAFWLHLLAAPMIVHPVFTLLGLTEEGGAGVGDAVAVIALYILLGLAAVAVDRRALLVSALAYVLWALNSLFQMSGAIELSFALTALVIGSALLMLSAFWSQTRRAVLKPLPDGLRARLAPIERTAVVRTA
jgi:MFS family permease